MTPTPPLADAPFEGPQRRPIRREAQAAGRIEVAPRNAVDGFPAAARHTRRVRFLRVALPLVAAGAVAGYFVLTRSNAPTGPAATYDDVVFGADATVIERPRLEGYQAGGEAYNVEADRATQRNDAPDILTLEGVRATFELPDGITAAFTAPLGEYDTRNSLMRLSGGLTMTLDDGTTGTMETLTVDVPAGQLTTDRPFALAGNGVTVEGNTLDMTADRMTVGGGVHAVVTVEAAP